MNLNEYEALAMRTAKKMEQENNLIHATLGLASEVGELSDTVKKKFAYGQTLDVANLIEELGDILWFCALAANTINVPLSYIAEQNIDKLKRRYPEKFSDELAELRLDKEKI